MVLSFRSSSPSKFEIVGTDPDGRSRRVIATKHADDFNWNLQLSHPGRSWSAKFHGPNVLDAMSELLASHDSDFRQDKARGDRPQADRFDSNRSVDVYEAPIVPIPRKF
jgi:hypothetical protein